MPGYVEETKGLTLMTFRRICSYFVTRIALPLVLGYLSYSITLFLKSVFPLQVETIAFVMGALSGAIIALSWIGEDIRDVIGV
jgi:hypothetical protein